MRRAVKLLALALLASTLPALAEKPAAAPQGPRLLEEEYALAKQPEFYFLMDLGAKTIELKARGLVLRRWSPDALRSWGAPVTFGPVGLARKTALTPPQRRVIKPGEPETVSTKPGQFELEALEVKDMPPAYILELEDGTAISIVTRGKRFARLVRDLKWYIGLPLRTLKLKRQKGKMTLIEMRFADPKEGQAMYWALTEGLKGLVWLSHTGK